MLGFVLVGLALLILEVILALFKASWFDSALDSLDLDNASAWQQDKGKNYPDLAAQDLCRRMFELVAGYAPFAAADDESLARTITGETQQLQAAPPWAPTRDADLQIHRFANLRQVAAVCVWRSTSARRHHAR